MPRPSHVLLRPTRRPQRAVRYGVAARLADLWHARRDARSGLPGPDVTLTPTVAGLSRTFDDRAHRERLQADVDTAERRARDVELCAEIVRIEAELSVLAERRAELDDGDLDARAPGEQASDPAVVRMRRTREQAAARSTVDTAVQALRAQRHRVERERVRTGRETEIRYSVAAVRVRRLHAHTLRRIACYERNLLRRHADGALLNPLLQLARPELPAWVDARPAEI